MLLLRLAPSIPALGQSCFHLPGIESYQLHQRHITEEHLGQLIHRLAPNEHFEQIQQHKLHRGDQDSLDSGQLHPLKQSHHPYLFQEHKKLVEQARLAQLVDLFDFFPSVECLGYLRIIAPGELPGQALLYSTRLLWLAFLFTCCSLVWIHLPYRFFPQLTNFFPHEQAPRTLYQNISDTIYRTHELSWYRPCSMVRALPPGTRKGHHYIVGVVECEM